MRTARAGFTLIELLIVVTIAAVVITLGTLAFSDYFQRDAARRAAQVFAQDLTAARSFALRSSEPVVIRFYEGSLWYEVVSQSTATEIARRRFGTNADIDLSGVTLDLAGDSLLFDSRGMADMVAWGTTIATATFSSGAITYRVSFNGMGASKIEQS
ncbi:MAG: GspH/FimT family pseudopilin [Gemmatimonadota bacterium]